MLIPASRLLRCARRGRLLVPDDAKGAGLRGLGGAKGGLVDTGRACHYGMFHTDFQVAASLRACMAQGEEHVAWWYLDDNRRVSLERRRSPGQQERLPGVKQVVTSSSASGECRWHHCH